MHNRPSRIFPIIVKCNIYFSEIQLYDFMMHGHGLLKSMESWGETNMMSAWITQLKGVVILRGLTLAEIM